MLKEGIAMIEKNIQILRKRNKMSQEELAEITGTSRQTVSKWESGESIPDIISCIRLAEAFGITVDDLVNYDEGEEILPIPPKGKHLFGTVTLGSRGQIVLPKKARDIFKLEPGDQLVVLGDEEQGLALLKANEMMKFFKGAFEKQDD